MAPDDLLTRVHALEDELAAMQARLDGLLAELARAGGYRAMRDSRQCPACGGRSLLHVRALREIGAEGVAVPLCLSVDATWRRTTRSGPLEAFVCRACKLVELQAIDLDGLVADGEHVVAIEPEPAAPSAGPYR